MNVSRYEISNMYTDTVFYTQSYMGSMPRNVVLLVLDCARRDFSSKMMRRLHERADLDIYCRAASTWSVPAHGSLITGQLPHKHGVNANNFDYTTIDNTFLDEVDHRTVGTSSNSYASSTFGFDTHFDYFMDVRPNRYFTSALDINDWLGSNESLLKNIFENDYPIQSIANVSYLGLKHLTQQLPMPALIDEGMRRQIKILQRESSNEPFIMFANIMEAHRPMYQHIGLDKKYAPYRWSSRSVGKWEINTSDNPNKKYESYLETYRNLYKGSLRYMDHYINEFISNLIDQTNQETTVIVTADHGEGLALPNDNGIIDHTGIFTDSVLEVPFLVFNPPQNLDVDFVSHLDVPKIIKEIARDQIPEITRNWAPSETIGAMGTPDQNKSWWNRTCRGLWNPDQVYRWDSETDELPPEIAEEYFDIPIELLNSASSYDFDDATQTQLENLGYL